MTARREAATTHLPLTPYVFQILLALADGEKHGYAILKDVRDRTGGTVRLGTGTLYTAIKRLLEREWIERRSEDGAHEGPAAPRGPSYGLTKLGLAVARAEAERLELVLSVARERRLLRQGGIVPESGR